MDTKFLAEIYVKKTFLIYILVSIPIGRKLHWWIWINVIYFYMMIHFPTYLQHLFNDRTEVLGVTFSLFFIFLLSTPCSFGPWDLQKQGEKNEEP